jgi:hypothetical protein
MAMPERPARLSIDLQQQATIVEQVGGAALVCSALVLAGLGVARILGEHPSWDFFVAALALAGAGVLVLVVSFGSAILAHSRRTIWSGRADFGTPGVLLFLLEPAAARRDPAQLVAALGPLRCLVGAAGAGAGAGAGGTLLEAPDERISRIRGTAMTRYHHAFFEGAGSPWSGTYEFSWEERLPGGEWRLLTTGTAEVELLEAAEEPEAAPQPEAARQPETPQRPESAEELEAAAGS